MSWKQQNIFLINSSFKPVSCCVDLILSSVSLNAVEQVWCVYLSGQQPTGNFGVALNDWRSSHRFGSRLLSGVLLKSSQFFQLSCRQMRTLRGWTFANAYVNKLFFAMLTICPNFHEFFLYPCYTPLQSSVEICHVIFVYSC